MTADQAARLAKQDADETGEAQSIVLLRRRFYGRPMFVPIVSRCVGGLNGETVGRIEPMGQIEWC